MLLMDPEDTILVGIWRWFLTKMYGQIASRVEMLAQPVSSVQFEEMDNPPKNNRELVSKKHSLIYPKSPTATVFVARKNCAKRV